MSLEDESARSIFAATTLAAQAACKRSVIYGVTRAEIGNCATDEDILLKMYYCVYCRNRRVVFEQPRDQLESGREE